MSTTQDALRTMLFEAVDAGDLERLSALCAAHEAEIVAAFPGWQTVPLENRQGVRLRWYVQGITSVAQHMAAARGRPELFDALAGASAETGRMFDGVQMALVEVDRLIAAGEFGAGLLRAREAVGLVSGVRTPLVSLLWGRVGQCHFYGGEVVLAAEAFERALVESEVCDDLAGRLASLDSLSEVYRYLGDSDEAGLRLLRMAVLLEDAGRSVEALRVRKRAAVLRAGEPLCRVALDVSGETVELEEAALVSGRVQLVYLRNRPTIRAALLAVEAGERAGSIGDYSEALALFERASLVDPFDPSPVYQAAVTLMFLDRHDEAAVLFRKTDVLAPGWYRCRMYAYLAERIAARTLSPDVFLLVTALDRPDLTPEEKSSLASQGIAGTNLSFFHGALGDAYRELGRFVQARTTYRHALGLAEEPDVKTQLLVKLGGVVEDPVERVSLFAEAIELSGNATAVAAARLSLLRMPRA